MSTKTAAGICRHCSGGCGARYTVRGGELVAMSGDPSHPLGQGGLCHKAWPGAYRPHPSRVTRPLLREAYTGEWREISWRQAISLLAARLQAARDAGWAEADARTDGIAIFGSAAITNEESWLLAKFARLLGTPYIEHQARV